MVLSLYRQAWRPVSAVLRRGGAQAAHEIAISLLRLGDSLPGTSTVGRVIRRVALARRTTAVGGVTLQQPLIVSAGLVKGAGFADEFQALAAVHEGRNVVAGWRTVPALLGPVEFGSFTRLPRPGNGGRVVWRDDRTRSMQNRVGLKNPGAAAAAAFLRSKGADLPRVWGVSLAPTPGIDGLDAMAADLDDAATHFIDAFERHPRPPSWYTLNLSCPNTEDDPGSLQTDALARRLAGSLVGRVRGTPVWVKVGPDLGDEQYRVLARAFADVGVSAVIATNTLSRPVPQRPTSAGVSGHDLREHALAAVKTLAAVIGSERLQLDIVASGGILDGDDLVDFEAAGASAAMLYSALVFRGPLAPALILREAGRATGHDRQQPARSPQVLAGRG